MDAATESPSTSPSGSSPTCSRSHPRTATLFRGFINELLEGINRPVGGAVGHAAKPPVRLPGGADGRPRRSPRVRPDQLPARRRRSTVASSTSPRGHRDDGPAAGCRDRHHLERDRLVHLAPGLQPGRPHAPGGRARPVAGGHKGAAPGLRARHHGPAGEGRHGVARLSDEGRRLDPALVPRGRKPRPGRVRGRRTGWSSIGRSIATPPSAWGSTAASARTWPAWSCG